MYVLYYHTSCAIARQIKVLLNFAEVPYEVVESKYWEKETFVPGDVFLPVLINQDLGNIEGHYAILEYCLSNIPNLHLFPHKTEEKNEARRMLYMINDVMNRAVCIPLIYEKLLRVFLGTGAPDMNNVKLIRKSMSYYIFYFSHFVKKRSFMLYDRVSIVDIALAAQVSLMDYFGEISWCQYPDFGNWYGIIKSLPDFNIILKERIGYYTPPQYYTNLDF